MFDNMTFDYLLQNMLDRVPDCFDKREGSIIYNALAPSAAELAEAYILLSLTYDEAYADTCSYNSLVKKCRERGITPLSATNAIAKAKFNIDVPIGSRFSLDDLNFVVVEKINDKEFKLQCEETGPISVTGNLIPIEYIQGLESAILTEILVNGEYEEDEDSLRKRYFNSLESEAFGGNIADYKEKVNKLQDVGGVKVDPVWKGGGTVRLVIINSKFETPSNDLIARVQEKIDPLEHQGKGVGIAPIDHVVTIEGVKNTEININTKITYESGWNFEELKGHIEECVDSYFTELNKTWEDNENLVIRISQIETRILSLEGVLDIENTSLNGVESNLKLDKYCIAKRGVISA